MADAEEKALTRAAEADALALTRDEDERIATRNTAVAAATQDASMEELRSNQ